jgi:hypothetical protein
MELMAQILFLAQLHPLAVVAGLLVSAQVLV